MTIRKIKEIRFTIYGVPRGKAMPRAAVNKKTGKVFMFSDDRSKAWEDSVFGQSFKFKPPRPIEGPIALGAVFYRAMPKAIANHKIKRELALGKKIFPTPKPDVKNLIANVEDALKGVFWIDDSQVVQYVDIDGTPMGKYYGEVPKVDVLIRPL
jgi:Holliday junction resolvase RusA-like endonuclease